MSLDSVRDVIDTLGGIAAVAELTNAKPKTVSAWQTWRGAFPPNTYVLLTQELERRGHHAHPRLWAMKLRRARTRGSRQRAGTQ